MAMGPSISTVSSHHRFLFRSIVADAVVSCHITVKNDKVQVPELVVFIPEGLIFLCKKRLRT